ncbi:MAG: tetratricopeptide repeat protein [PVC group bacterium]
MIKNGTRDLPWRGGLLIILLTILVFSPSLGSGFVNWDDNQLLKNTGWRGCRPDNIAWWFTSMVNGDYKPLVWASYNFDYLFWSFNPAGYHLSNVLIHALNAWLVFLILLKLGGGRNIKGSVLGAVFFSIHPLRIESVAWIAERKDVLLVFFYLTSIIFYLNYALSFAGNLSSGPKDRRHGTVNYIISLLFALMSCLVKPMAVSLPAVLLLIDCLLVKRREQSYSFLVIEKLPYCVFALFTAAVALVAQNKFGSLASFADIGFGVRLYLWTRTAFFYLGKIILPVNLWPLYQGVVFDRVSVFFLLLNIIGLITIMAWMMYLRRRGKDWPLFAYLFYLITLFPASGFFPTGATYIADRFTYLPSLGISLAICYAYSGINYFKSRFAWLVGWCGLLALSLLTIEQEQVWENSLNLWRRALKSQPGSSIANELMGNAFHRMGKNAEAIKFHHRAVRAKPDDPDRYNNLAIVLADEGELDAAIYYYRQALKIKPNHLEALNNLGNALVEQGKLEEALDCYAGANRINPYFAGAYYNSGVVLFRQGKYVQAIEFFSRALELNPGFENARSYLERARQRAVEPDGS